MAGDDKVVRIVFTLEGGRQFRADVSEAVAAVVTGSIAIENAEVKITNARIVGSQRRTEASQKEAAAANTTADAQIAAANKAASAFGPATDRVIDYTNRRVQSLDALRRKLDPIAQAVVDAQRRVDSASANIQRFGTETEKGAEAAGLLVRALEELSKAQANLQSSRAVTSTTQLGGMSAAIEEQNRAYNESIDILRKYAQSGLNPIIAKHDQATASARAMVAELAAVNSALVAGIIDTARAVDLNEKIISSYDLAAVSARKFAEEQAKVNAIVRDTLSPKTIGQEKTFTQGSTTAQSGTTTGNQTRTAAVSSTDLISGAKESAAQAASDYQAAYNKILGVNENVTKSAQESASAFEEQFIAMEQLDAEAQRIKDSLNPIAAIERNLGDEIARLGSLAGPTRLSLAELNQQQKNLENAAKIKIQDVSGVTAAQDDYARLSRAAQDYREKLNPLLEAQRKYSTAIKETQEFVSVGLIPQRQATITIDDYSKKLETINANLREVDKAQLNTQQITKQFRPTLQTASRDFLEFGSTATKSFGLNRIGLLQLQAAGVNAFQSLAAGISPFRTAITEGAQVVGAFIQGTNLGFKQFVAYAVPIAAVTTAIIGVTAAIAAAASKAQLIRELNVALDQFHRGTAITAQDLENIAKGFRASGESASVVNTILAEIARNPTLDPAFSKQLIETSRNIGSAFGTDLTDGYKRLSTALEGGAQGIIDLGTSLGVLTPKQIAEILTLNRTVGAQAAVKKGYEDIVASLHPYTDTLSPIDRLTRALTASWNSFVEALAKSAPIQAALTLINKLTDSLTNLNSEIDKGSKLKEQRLSNTVSGALGGAASGAVAGAIVTSPGLVTTPLGAIGGAIAGGVAGAAMGYNYPVTDTTRGTSVIAQVPRISTATNVVIDTPDLERIGRVFAEASKTLPAGQRLEIQSTERPGATVAGTGQPSQHGFGRAADIAIVDSTGKRVAGYMSQDTTGQYTALFKTAAKINEQMFPGTQLFDVKGDAGHVMTAPGGTLGAGPGPTTETAQAQAQALGKVDDELQKNKDLLQDQIPAWKLYGAAQEAATASITAYNQVLEATGDKGRADAAGKQAALEVITKQTIEISKQTATQDLANKTGLETARITGQDEVAGLQAAAKAAATLANQQNPLVNVQERYNQLLATGAVEALNAGAKAIPALIEQTAASERLAIATGKGASEEHQAVLENQAAVVSHNALAAAKATGNQQLIQEAERLETVNLLLIRRNDIAQQSADINRTVQQNKDQSEVISLQLSLQGRATEEITKQTALLQTQQQIRGKYSELSEKDKQAWLDSVNAVQNMNIALIEAQRNTERINNLVLDIANTITDSLTAAIEDAFDQKKAKDWGETLKGVLKDVIKSASENLFIKPVLGSLASALGFSGATTSLGTVGGLSGLFGGAAAATELAGTNTNSSSSSTNTAAGTTTTTTTTNADGSTKTTTTAGIGGSSTSGLLGLGGSLSSATGTVKDWLNTEIGPALGFAKPETTLGTDFSSDTGVTTTATEAGTTGIFGTDTTLTGALGGAATGFGAGATVSSLLGGNTKIGSAGGLVGGTIGSVIGGPIGGLVGGALGGLTGLFGNNKKSADAAGADVNLTTGALSRTVSSANTTSNQDVKDISSGLKTFTRDLETSLGRNLDASVQIQSSVRDGIKTTLSVGGTSGGEKKFASAQDAIDQIELDIVHGISGLTGTLKTVLDQVTDPADIDAAVKFAADYDALKEAADSAFSSIETDTSKIGVYAQAMEDLNTTFDDITVSANQFGLSLDPITKGLDEATKRLQKDFKESLDSALDDASSKDYINTLKDVSAAYKSNIREAKAIGLDTDTDVTKKTAKLEVAKANETLSTLTFNELNNVYAALQDTNPEIAQLALVLINAGAAADDASKSIVTLTDGLKSVKDLATSLTSGKLSGLTDAAATTVAIKEYEKAANVAKAAGTLVSGTQLDTLVTAAEAAVDASLAAYGNAPKTADLRRQILADLKIVRSAAIEGESVTTIPKAVTTEQAKIRTDVLAETAARGTVANYMDGVANDNQRMYWQGAMPAVSASGYSMGSVPSYWADGASTPMMYCGGSMSSKSYMDGTYWKGAMSYVNQKASPAYRGGVTPYRAGDVGVSSYLDGSMYGAGSSYAMGVIGGEYGGGSTDIDSIPKGGTAPGKILVGEIGPEWMLPKSEYVKGGMDKWNWQKVGKDGPEIIDQAGGATILPFPIQPRDFMIERIKGAYADGTDDIASIPVSTGFVAPAGTSDTNIKMGSTGDVVLEIRSLRIENRGMREELAAIKKQIQGGQVQANIDSRTGNSRLSSIDAKLGTGIVTPTRSKVG